MTRRGSRRTWLGSLVRNLARGSARDADLRADVASYTDLLTDEKVKAGMAHDAARRAALVEIGSAAALADEVRDVRAGAMIAAFGQDARYALRLIRRDWVFSAVAVITLALGIGANTAIFSVVKTVLLEPLPYRDADSLVLVWERNRAIGKDRDLVAALNYQDWRQQSRAFARLGAYRFTGYALTGENPEQIVALSASSSVFGVLEVNPLLGRTFTEDEERRRDRVVVLRHEFWQRRFGGDRAIVGRSIALNGNSFVVVGVMPPDFRFPDGNSVDVYTPLVLANNDLTGRRSHSLTVIGRLADGVAIETASADVGSVAQAIASQDNGSNPEVTVIRAQDVLVEDVRLGLLVLFGTVGFVLLIACGNVANLLLVRAAARRREMAVRSALGAGSGRLVRQLLTESVILALLGGVAGVVVAWVLLGLLSRVHPPDLARAGEVTIDFVVLLFAMSLATLTGVVFGVVPSLHASRADLREAVETGGRHQTRAFRTSYARSLLLSAEMALSLMLLVGAGLMIRSLLKAQTLDLGFQAANVLTAQIALPFARYPLDPGQYRAAPLGVRVQDSKPAIFFGALEERLRTLPGVQSAGAVSSLPLNPVGADYDLPVVVEGRPRPRTGEEPQADFRVATPGYFRTMGIPLLAGREFTDLDGPNSSPVAVINETMAREMFAGEDPLGQRLILYGRSREIVGVIGSVRHHGFSRGTRPEMILPYRQFQLLGMTLVVRGAMEPPTLSETVAKTVLAIDPDQPVYRVRPMSELLSDSVAQPRFTTLLLVGFAVLALTLAIVGVYGVMSYSVSQRAREIGVRMALGADRREVVWMVIRQGMTLAAVGLLIGLVGAAASAQLMKGLLFGIRPIDPATFVAAAAALGLTSLGAMCVPALRAARVAPVNVLRSE